MTGTTIKTALCLLGALALDGAARGSHMMEALSASSAVSLRERPLSTSTSTARAPVAVAPALAAPAPGHARACAAERPGTQAGDHARLPLYFEINRGQSAPDVLFAARGQGYGLFLTATDAVLILSSSSPVRMAFAGANRAPVVSGLGELPGKANYFRGRDPAGWRTNIPTYAKVAYRDLYPGIDLVYYGNQQQLEYDLIVSPNVDPGRIALSFEGVDSVDVTTGGELVLRSAGVEVRQQKPVIYQQIGDARQAVRGRYVLRDTRQVGFELGPYDASRTLVIDPALAFSSYLGGTRVDMGQRVAVDAVGNVYLTGTTTSPDFPVTTGGTIASDFDEVFVAKVNAGGSALNYATYLGGTGSDRGRDVAIDAAGHAYVTGFTDSVDFPIRDAVQPIGGILGDAFVAELSTGGDALVYATYLGGSRRDIGESIAVDRSGSAYVTGSTISSDFPTTPNVFQPALGGIDPSQDAFVTKLAPGGTALVYSTFLGGGEGDGASGIAVNASGNAYVTGATGSGDFPRVRPFQPLAFRGIVDAFVTKVSQDGSALVYSSNLGGSETDVGFDIAVDASDRAVVGGFTTSDDYPTVRPLQPDLRGAFDGFVTIVSSEGSTLAFSTYLGGTSRDEITGIAVDGASKIYVVGRTFSSDFPIVRPVQPLFGGGVDAFVAKIDPQASRVLYASYLGGEGDDDGGGIAIDPAGSAYVIGSTQSDGFPVVRALQPGRAGEVDAFFAKVTDFDVCLQDDQSGNTLQFNTSSGGYQFATCGASDARLLGTGRIVRDGQLVLLLDQGVLALYNARASSGFARVVRQRTVLAITDRNTTNNTCTCQ